MVQLATLRLGGLRLQRADPENGRRYTLNVPEFTAGPMDRIGLVGESGSGKSTLLEVLGLLSWPDNLEKFEISPDGGAGMMDLTPIFLRRDTEVLTAIRARLIGFILQDGGLIPYLTVAENAVLAAELSTGHTSAARRRIRELATEIGIEDYLDRLPSSLSGGQRQRAAVLRAAAPGVALLLGDEPTASLDSKTAHSVMNALVNCAGQNQSTLILASHDVALLKAFDFRICQVTVTGTQEDRQATVSCPSPFPVRAAV